MVDRLKDMLTGRGSDTPGGPQKPASERGSALHIRLPMHLIEARHVESRHRVLW